jgi:hypothetical protein
MKYCDLYCEHAAWPNELMDGSKSCRTFIALYCRRLEWIVEKNTPCRLELDKSCRKAPVEDWKKLQSNNNSFSSFF